MSDKFYPQPKPGPRWKSEPYREMVSMERCLWCGSSAPNEPHHISWAGERGWSQKVHDYLTCPACQRCHNALHQAIGPWFREITRKIDREEIKNEMVRLMRRWIHEKFQHGESVDAFIGFYLSFHDPDIDALLLTLGAWVKGER